MSVALPPLSFSRRICRLFTLALVVGSSLAACGGGHGPPGAGMGGPGGPMPVAVKTLQPETVTLTRELNGRVTAQHISEVRPQVNGIVAQVLFTEGTMVEQGQALYQLDDATYRANANSAQAQLARAQATAHAAQLAAKRSSELVQQQVVSVQADEAAQAAMQQAQADVEVAKAALEAANVTLGYARITAPISGRIGRSIVSTGALVSAGQPAALTTITRLNPIWIDVTQSSAEWLQLQREFDAGRLQGAAEMPVDIVLEDGTLYPHKGRLSASEVNVDPSTGTYILRIGVDNPDNVLLPGMFVRAVLGSGVRENALLVPMQSVTRDPRGHTTAWTVGEVKGINPETGQETGQNYTGVVVRPITLSHALGDRWLVEDGLQAGDQVIVEGAGLMSPMALRPGMPVMPQDVDSMPSDPTAAPSADPTAETP